MKTGTLVIILLSALSYGLSQVVDKFNLNFGFDPLSYAFFLLFFQLFFLFIFGFFEKTDFKKEFLSLKRKDIFDLALIGVLISGFAMTIRLFGLLGSTATNSGIFQGVSILSTVLFSFFLLNERPTKKLLLLIFVMILGVFLLSTNGKLIIPKQGDLLLILSLAIPGFTNTYAKSLMNRLNSYTVSFGRILFGFLSLVVLAMFFKIDFTLSFYELLLLAGAGFILALRIRLFYESINLTNASYGATFLLLGALLTPILAFFTLGETLSPIQMLGAILIIGASYLLINTKHS